MFDISFREYDSQRMVPLNRERDSEKSLLRTPVKFKSLHERYTERPDQALVPQNHSFPREDS